MQLFIFGISATTAQKIADGLAQTQGVTEQIPVYDSLGWAADEFAATPEGAPILKLQPKEYRAAYQRFIRKTLAANPYHGLVHFEDWLEANEFPERLIVVGPATPDEFISMLQYADHNLVVHVSGSRPTNLYPDVVDEGRLWIEQYLAWRNRLGSPIPSLVCTETELQAELQAL